MMQQAPMSVSGSRARAPTPCHCHLRHAALHRRHTLAHRRHRQQSAAIRQHARPTQAPRGTHVRKQGQSPTARRHAAVPPDIDPVPSNLGTLSQFAATSGEDLSWAVNRVSPESFANRGLYVDTPVVLASGFLLLVLLALSFQRILGLDRLVADFMLKQQENRKQMNRENRQALERSWNEEFPGKGGDSSSNGSGK